MRVGVVTQSLTACGRMSRVFIGTEALATGGVTKYDLRARYQRVLPGVYAPKGPISLHDRTVATWLWSRRQGVISGVAASALHGAKWVADESAIEMNWPDHKPPDKGIVTRKELLLPGEVEVRDRVPVTTVERTAFDLARRGPVGRAVERLDALAQVANFKSGDVLRLSEHHPHVRGLRRLPRVLGLVDAGAQSPKETWLRLLLIDEGFPPPQTQIPVLGHDGYPRYFLDMGWPDAMVAVEYDGEQHRLDRATYRADLTRSEYVAWVGWRRVRVVAGDRRFDIVRRVHRAWN